MTSPPPDAPQTLRPLRPLAEVAGTFLRLGCIAFGGPIAHLGYLRAECVDRRRWIDDARYADLVALCQFLPGPASSQVVFALGMKRAGFAGAMIASLCFTLPSAALMVAFAFGVARAPSLRDAGWLHGLKLAAVAAVAQAVWSMGRRLCVDRARVTMALVAAAAILAAPGALAQVGVIAAGGLFGAWRLRREVSVAASPEVPEAPGAHRMAAGALALFFTLLAVLPALAARTASPDIDLFDSFYRSGALVFGGGHVVLPLLRAELAPRGLLSDERFLAGYGAAQALPGPLFTFASYLGACIGPDAPSLRRGLLCLFAIFLPAWLLIGGALPFWHRLRERPWAQAALAGANASVVGVLLAALYHPVITESVRGPRDVAAALLAYGLLELWKAPPWLVVLGGAAAGQWLLPR